MIYASTAVYTLAREIGREEAIAELRRQIVEELTAESFPVAKTFARLRTLDEIALHIDGGGVSIGRVRSRALYEARQRAELADVWVSCDDDVEASHETCRMMLEAVRQTRGVVAVPCWLRRREPVVNVILNEAGIVLPVGEHGAIMPCAAAGFGLVAVHQDAIQRIYEARMPQLAFLDEDGNEKCGAFVEVLEGGRWWTEDLAFFIKWLPEDVPRHILISGHTSHDGKVLDLSKVPQLPRMAYDDGPRVRT